MSKNLPPVKDSQEYPFLVFFPASLLSFFSQSSSKDTIFDLRDRDKQRERNTGRERNMDVREKYPSVASYMHPNGDRTCNTLQDDAPTNWAAQPGLSFLFLIPVERGLGLPSQTVFSRGTSRSLWGERKQNSRTLSPQPLPNPETILSPLDIRNLL